MKKFFGLKMTLAALAVVSFASCYDSEGGDVIIPNATSVVWPAPVYVVNGHVTGTAGEAIAEATVSGLNKTTDANGDFSASLTSPFSGDVNFTKDGYFRTTRTLNMASMTTGSAVYNLDATMYRLDEVNFAVKEIDVTSELDDTQAVPATAEAIEAIYGAGFLTNETTNQTIKQIHTSDLDETLPYGLKAVAAKSLEEDGELAFLEWFNKSNYFRRGQESPYADYVNYIGWLDVVIPAQFKVTKIKVTPVKVSKTLVFPFEEGDFKQAVEVYENYTVTVEGTSLAHDHGHGHGDGNGKGGGENE